MPSASGSIPEIDEESVSRLEDDQVRTELRFHLHHRVMQAGAMKHPGHYALSFLFIKYEPGLVDAARRAVFGRDGTLVNVTADHALPFLLSCHDISPFPLCSN
jgi:hypothetical protein